MALDIRNDVLLAPLTTLGLGGRARYFVEAKSIEDLREALEYSRRHSLRFFLLGGGSNTIFSDEGFNGLVVRMALRGIDGLPSSSVHAAAGEPFDAFIACSVAAGLGGLECLSGIPGQVGATPVQNVGAYGQEVSSVIERVDCIDQDGNPLSLSPEECRFSYRHSRFKDGDFLMITGVTFRLRQNYVVSEPAYPELKTAVAAEQEAFAQKTGRSPNVSEHLSLVREVVLKIRRRKSMVVDPADPDSKSVGSFFTNPVLDAEQFREFQARLNSPDGKLVAPVYPSGHQTKISAAWLVEQAGFPKGYTENGAGISHAHSLALVNRGGRTADLLFLAEKIQAAVRERFGITLAREPVLVPYE